MPAAGPCCTVRMAANGCMAPTVLMRKMLPTAHPPPQPSASNVKYGVPLIGLMGAKSALMVPVPMRPTFSPKHSKAVVLVKRSAQRSGSAPALVTSMGASASL